MNAAASRSEIKILQVTCSHCGHVREFERDEALTVQHLESMSAWRCIECSARGGTVFTFSSCSAAPARTFERLPTQLRLVEPARLTRNCPVDTNQGPATEPPQIEVREMNKHIESSICVRAPVRTVYTQWTRFEEFPRFMEGVKEVRKLDDKHVHWVAEIAGQEEEWDAEITHQIPDERIAWRSLDGARNAGAVAFRAIGENETEVRVRMMLQPESAVEKVGTALHAPDARVHGDLRRFKEFVESRGAATIGTWEGEGGSTAVPEPDSEKH